MSLSLRLKVLAFSAVASVSMLGAPTPAFAYPIDCAILLCLAGGWPASAECGAARAEFIRRITPFPVEPPLQLWRCPMRASFNPGDPAALRQRVYEATLRGFSDPAGLSMTPVPQPAVIMRELAVKRAAEPLLVQGADIDLSGPAFDLVRSIRVWNVIQFRRHETGSGDCNTTDNAQLGTYDMQGEFTWSRATAMASPAWLGVPKTGCDAWYRGVGIEWQDFQGNHDFEVVRY